MKYVYTWDDFSAWISQDPFFARKGGVYDAINADIDTDLKSVRLPTKSELHSTVVGHPHDINDSLKCAASSPLVLTDDNGTWYLYIWDEQVYKWKSGNFRKLLTYGSYNLILCKGKIHYRTETGGGSSSYWYLIWNNLAPAMASWNRVTWSGRSRNGSAVTHSANTNVLQPNVPLTIVATTYYRVYVAHTCTTWTCTVSIGWTTVGTLSTANQNGVYLRGTTASTANLVFTPTSGYDGTITAVTVNRSYVTESQRTFPGASDYKPYFINNANNLLIGDGRYVVQLARQWWSSYLPASGTFSWTDILLTLQNDETIYWIFGLWDQIVVFTNKRQYFRDGLNSYVDRIIEWDETIIGVAQNRNEFLVITGNSYSSYALWKTIDWYNRQLILRDESYASYYFDRNRMNANTSENYGNFMVNKGLFWRWGEITAPENGIYYTFGAKKAGYKESIRKWYTNYGIVSMVKAQTHYTYVGCYSWSSGKVYQIDDRKWIWFYENTNPGHIVSEKIIWQKQSLEKTWEKLLLGYRVDSYNTTAMPIAWLSYKSDNNRSYYTFLVDGWTNPIATLPTSWATYTISGNTYTVSDVKTYQYDTGKNYYLISATLTSGTNIPATSWTLTKSTWTGSSSIVYSAYNDYKLIWAVVNSSNYRQMFLLPIKFNEIILRCDIFSVDKNASPVVYDVTFTYDQVKDDTR